MEFKTNEEQNTQMRTQVEAVAYFKDNKGFKRIFEGFREKYASLGYVGGIVKLNSLSQDEKQALSGFLGKDLSRHKSASISVANFQKSINNSRFEGLSVEVLVNEYFQGKLSYKKELRQQAEFELKEFFGKLIVESNSDEKTIEWLQGVISEKIAPYSQLIHEYNENRDELFKLMINVMKGLSFLPECNNKIHINDKNRDKRSINKGKQMMRLPMFAARITGDPHYFDRNRKAYIYLLHGAYHRVNGSFITNVALNSEEEAEILYKAGLMKDDISNFVMCYGIRGNIKEDFKEHRGLKGFFDLGEPSMLSLLNINKLEAAYSVNDKVFVFENPSVFAEFIESHRQNCKNSDANVIEKNRCSYASCQISAICSAGQPNLAVLLLLDLLVASGSEIYYSGDFDPEGLLIADRLKSRYGKSLKLWHLGLEDYKCSISEKDISEKRLKQLEKLQTEELIKVAEAMKRVKKAGYQEKLIITIKKVYLIN